MKYYKERHFVSFLILLSVFLTLLLSLNFHVWNDSYKEGSLEELVIEQEALLGESLMLEESNRMQQCLRDTYSKRLPLLIEIVLFSTMSGIFFFQIFLLIPLFYEFLPCVTLCNLSVRMNR